MLRCWHWRRTRPRSTGTVCRTVDTDTRTLIATGSRCKMATATATTPTLVQFSTLGNTHPPQRAISKLVPLFNYYDQLNGHMELCHNYLPQEESPSNKMWFLFCSWRHVTQKFYYRWLASWAPEVDLRRDQKTWMWFISSKYGDPNFVLSDCTEITKRYHIFYPFIHYQFYTHAHFGCRFI